jgi:hypothetical protein
MSHKTDKEIDMDKLSLAATGEAMVHPAVLLRAVER